MHKIGILLTAFNCEDTLEECLKNWKNRDDCVIRAVSVPFEEYKDLEGDNSATLDILKKENIDTITEPKYIKEADARNLALKKLLSEGVSYIMILDGDEVYSKDDIDNLFKFVYYQDEICWFSINLKNYVFDNNHYIDNFCPPRVFKVRYYNLLLSHFYFDNDLVYLENQTPIKYKELSTLAVPKRFCYPKHYTWLNNDRSRKKIEYQNKHFNGICSYVWNAEKKCVEFNSDFYSKYGMKTPEIKLDES